MSAAQWLGVLIAVIVAVNLAVLRWLRRRSNRLPLQPLPPERVRRAGGVPPGDARPGEQDEGVDGGTIARLRNWQRDLDAQLDEWEAEWRRQREAEGGNRG